LVADAGKDIAEIDARKASEPDGTFFKGENRDVVSAEMQAWLGTAANEAGAQLQSIENTAITDENKGNYVGLTANISGTWKAIQNVIFRIETAQPMLFVQDVQIQASSYGEQDSVEPQVTMRILFLGAMRLAGRRDGA